MNRTCLTDDELNLLAYGEEDPAVQQAMTGHLAECPACRRAYEEVQTDLRAITFPAIEGGERAERTATRVLGLSEPSSSPSSTPTVRVDEIMTIEEVARFLKVSPVNVMNTLPRLPHFLFDGHLRVRRAALLDFLMGLEQQPSRPVQENVRAVLLKRDLI